MLHCYCSHRRKPNNLILNLVWVRERHCPKGNRVGVSWTTCHSLLIHKQLTYQQNLSGWELITFYFKTIYHINSILKVQNLSEFIIHEDLTIYVGLSIRLVLWWLSRHNLPQPSVWHLVVSSPDTNSWRQTVTVPWSFVVAHVKHNKKSLF